MNEKEHKSNEKFEKIINNLENENRTLNEQMKTLNVDFKSQMDELKSQINNETRIQIDNIIKENEVNYLFILNYKCKLLRFFFLN